MSQRANHLFMAMPCSAGLGLGWFMMNRFGMFLSASVWDVQLSSIVNV